MVEIIKFLDVHQNGVTALAALATALATVILSLLTWRYMIQLKRDRKYQLNRELIEKIYSPVFDSLRELIGRILVTTGPGSGVTWTSWRALRKDYRMYLAPATLQHKMEEFTKRCERCDSWYQDTIKSAEVFIEEVNKEYGIDTPVSYVLDTARLGQGSLPISPYYAVRTGKSFQEALTNIREEYSIPSEIPGVVQEPERRRKTDWNIDRFQRYYDEVLERIKGNPRIQELQQEINGIFSDATQLRKDIEAEMRITKYFS